MVKCSPHNLQMFICLQLNKVAFLLSISINPICTKLDLTHLYILSVRQQIIQLESQDGETCGVFRKLKLYRRFHPVEVTSALNKKLRHCKIFSLTTYDPLFLQLWIHSGPHKTV